MWKMNKILKALFLASFVMALTGCYGLGGVKKAPPEGRETGRDYLVGKQGEKKGYGLYSYLLFGSPPTAATRERYLQAIFAYFAIPPISIMEAYLPREQLNVTYLLLADDPPPDVVKCLGSQCVTRKKAIAEWVLDHYNYGRARVLLRALPGTHRDGPYIVSHFKPLTGREALSGQYLYQNLSSVPPSLVLSWVKEFLNQAAEEHHWEGETARQLALNLRTTIEILAKGLPDVLKALDGWIAWIS